MVVSCPLKSNRQNKEGQMNEPKTRDPVLRALQITIAELRELSAEDRKRVLETAEQWLRNSVARPW